jgi:hypothetical protein
MKNKLKNLVFAAELTFVILGLVTLVRIFVL